MRRIYLVPGIILICILMAVQSAWPAGSDNIKKTSGNLEVIKPHLSKPSPKAPIIIRSDWNYPPFEYLNAQKKPEGFNIDIVRAVARVMNIPITINLGPWDEVRQQLENGEIDAIAGMFKTPERDKKVDFSIPHLIVSYAVFVRKHSGIKSIADIKNKTIIVQNKDLGHDYLLENHIGKKIITQQNWEEVLKTLSRGEGDCAIVSRLQGVRLIDKLNIKNIHPVGPPIIQRKYCIAVKEGDTDLLYQINEGLSIIKTTGEYDRIYEKWFKVYEHEPLDIKSALQYISWILLPFVVAISIMLAWSWSLKRKVLKKTLDLETELSERERTEAALRESEARFRRLTENAQDIIYRMTLPDGRYEYINEAANSILGYPPSQIMATPKFVQKIIHPDSRAFFENAWADILKGIIPKTYEYKIIDASGNTKWLFQRNVLVSDDKGNPIALEGLVTDITRQKQAAEERAMLEAQLHRAEKMETLGTLAGGVAHDLNNVLGAIVGYPDLLLADLPSDSPMRFAIKEIKASGEKAALIVQDLLTLARRNVSTDEVINFNTIITNYKNSREFKRLKEQNPEIQIDFKISDNLFNVWGSAVHLSKVVMNLIQNAFESISGQGQITLTTENIYLDRAIRGYDTVNEGDYILIKISDTGIGISPKDLNHIFEPFYTRKVMGHSGSGLGMAIVWSAVKDHKGYIDIQSQENHGTTVSIFLPVTRKEIEDMVVQQFKLSDYAGQNKKILVVDDIKAQRELAASMLKKLEYQVETVDSGQAAVAYLEKNSVDLVLLDMIMDTGMDGLKTYTQILKIHASQKAIVASGFAETDRVREAQRLGAKIYIKKPFSFEILAKAVHDVLKES